MIRSQRDILAHQAAHRPARKEERLIEIGGSKAVRGAAGLAMAKITGHAGTTAPFVYNAVKVEHDGSAEFTADNYVAVAGGDNLSWKLINLSEVGTMGIGVAPLENGSIVAYAPMGERFMCQVSNYRGTYT